VAFAVAVFGWAAPTLQAAPLARVVAAQPQGEVAAVRQVRVRFDRAVSALGDARAADPFGVRCEGAPVTGSGRWSGEREWLYDFSDALPPGVRCEVELRTDWRPVGSAAGGDAATVGGITRFAFSTGGPAVLRVRPWPGGTIDEDAAFILQFNGEPVAGTVRERARCIVDGLGDAIATRLVDGAERDALLASQRITGVAARRSVILACERPLPVDTPVRLVLMPGVAAAANPALTSRVEQSFSWRVRPAFSAEFSCERERAGAPCWPVRPLTLSFSAPVARAAARQVRLVRTDGGAAPPIAAVVEGEPGDPLARFLRFPVPLAENASYRIELPADLRDDSGRALVNAASFPLRVTTAAAPPIAKFAAAPFGVIELEPADRRDAAPGPRGVLPLTLRHVQPDFATAPGAAAPPGPAAPGAIRVRRLDSAAEIIEWIGRVERYHESSISAREAGRPRAEWTELETITDERGRSRTVRRDRFIDTRELSLLRGDAAAASLALPAAVPRDRRADAAATPAREGAAPAAPRPFEVVGLPLAAAGYHVVEVESPRLGASLLDAPKPMFVRTGVLVTNLAVHFKHGRESSAVWVTRLDRGRPVEGAEVSVHDCRGGTLWTGRTDAQGLARIERPLDPLPARPAASGKASGSASAPPGATRAGEPAGCPAQEALFVLARHQPAARGNAVATPDLAFVFSSWQRGIEPWRFGLPTNSEPAGDRVAHTVFDRTLLRAGETVSMKHFVRVETARGLASIDPGTRAQRVVLVHTGTGQETPRPLAWNGTRSATSAWDIPAGARLGRYEVWLEAAAAAVPAGEAAARSAVPSAMPPAAPSDPARTRLYAGDFRVEAFRVPLIDARLIPPADLAPGARDLALGVQMSYLAGGGVQQSTATLSALLAPREPLFAGFEDFRFTPPRDLAAAAGPAGEEAAEAPAAGRLVADKLPVTTDRQGAGRVRLAELPAVDRASELLAELSFVDPNGEIQTVTRRLELWPSSLVLGVRSASWAGARGRAGVQVAALDTRGAPRRGVAVQVRGRQLKVMTTRQRMVGGFYAYDNRTEVQDLGVLCSGSTDERGVLRCETAPLPGGGEVELIAEAQDAAGRPARAATSVWIAREGEVWFEQDDDDRIDVLPERRRYAPGETARLQVRSPFRAATALVAIEREGVLDLKVLPLRGDDPTIELTIDPAWTPNVYVSVLAVRGRVREVPWTSFFDWGWRSPLEWWRAWRHEAPDHQPPTALVDLAKPSFRLGAASIEVGSARHDLQVSVLPDAPRYTIRQTAQARIRVLRDGRPLVAAPGAAAPVVDVAFAAVDDGLLALAENRSWDLKAGLLRERPWGVSTSTAQGEIVGRRHYGRKAVAAGGGGGRGATRELFDTLLVWRASVALDERGEALVPVPLNDSLTRFRLVAVADALIPVAEPGGEALHAFGTGSATIEVSQDLQLLPGLPLAVRESDRFDALLTLRNTTERAMTVEVTLRGRTTPLDPAGAPQVIEPPAVTVAVAAGAATELRMPVEVPGAVRAIDWEAGARESGTGGAVSGTASSRPTGTGAGAAGSPASDRVRRRQVVEPAVPLRVQQASIAPLEGAWTLPVAAPAGALVASVGGVDVPRGGVEVGLVPRLGDGLPGLRRWFEAYPYSCLEQRASRALALEDRDAWAALLATLPSHLDADGLAAYFPLSAGADAAGAGGGSDRLTAYLVAAAHEAGVPWPRELLDPMLSGLVAFVEGRLERRPWAPAAARGLDRDVRRLAALEALSRHGRAQARMLSPIRLDPATWPTAAVLDWMAVLRRVPGIADAPRRLEEARQVLRSRLAYSGSTLRFSREADDHWWWLMDSADGNAARLVLAALDDAALADELPRLVNGHLARQRDGAWLTTTANLWSALALRRFSQRFESTPVTGRTVASLAGREAALDWTATPAGGRLALPWPPPASPAAAAALPAGASPLALRHEGGGRPWLSVQALAAVPLAAPVRAGYSIRRSVTAVERREASAWSRGDVWRVRLEIDAASDMTWVVVDDPLPAGATVLGSGLARDSALAQRDENRPEAGGGDAPRRLWPGYVDRTPTAWRGYVEFLPRGRHVVEYTLRLNQPGRFALPPTRVEAMYAPETFGESPNAPVEVRP
jgi:hypothetical protein